MIKSVNPNQLTIDSMISADNETELTGLYKGDKVLVTTGHHKGKTGRIYKMCSKAFPNWCRVEFDLTGRERVKKTSIMEKTQLKAIR